MMMQKEKTVGKAKTVGTLFSGNDLKKLIFPLIIEQILAVSVGMVDTMMVSSAGEAATSGVSLVDIINVLIINIFAAVATGGAVVASQYLGQKRKDRACQSADPCNRCGCSGDHDFKHPVSLAAFKPYL